MNSATAVHPVCSACRIGGQRAAATHASRYGDGHAWCDQHASAGDPPFARDRATVEAAARREMRWPLSVLEGLSYE